MRWQRSVLEFSEKREKKLLQRPTSLSHQSGLDWKLVQSIGTVDEVNFHECRFEINYV